MNYAMVVSRFLNNNSLVSLAAGFLLAVPLGAAYAVTGEPLPFDQFTVTNGEISAACPDMVKGTVTVTTTCGTPTISDGMLQREVVVSGSGDPTYDGTYIQFILTESGASGDAAAAFYSTDRGSLYFTGEDFIKMNNRGAGIASKQTILESNFNDATLVEDRFDITTQFRMGWAQGGGVVDPWIDMTQNTSSIQYNDSKLLATSAYELFDSSMVLKSDATGTDHTFLEMSQRVLMEEDNPLLNGTQKFKHSRVSGVYNNQGTDIGGAPFYINTTTFMLCSVQPPAPLPPECVMVTPPQTNGNPLLPGGTNGGEVIWASGDTVEATWIGMVAPAIVDSIFGLTRYENITQNTLVPGDSPVSTLISRTSAEAGGALGAWDAIVNQAGQPLFGHAEAMADVTPVSITDFAVMSPTVLMGAANPDYIANSDPALTSLPGAVTIADTDYDLWTVENGVFTATCPTWADTCASVTINEGGVYQRWITAGGEQYLQTILVDDGGKAGVLDPMAADYAANSVGFRMETFVKAGAGNGIASQMYLAERGSDTAYLAAPTAVDMPVGAGDFTNKVSLNLGWANRGSLFVARDMDGNGSIDPGEGIIEPHAAVAIDQGLIVTDNIQTDAVSMENLFSLVRGQSQADKRITLSSRVGTQIGFVDPIEFRNVTVMGEYQRTARTDFADPFMLPGNSSDLTWVAGDALQASWLSAQYGTNPAIPVSQIASTGFNNLTTGESISYTELGTPAPMYPDNWLVDPFLEAPVYNP